MSFQFNNKKGIDSLIRTIRDNESKGENVRFLWGLMYNLD